MLCVKSLAVVASRFIELKQEVIAQKLNNSVY